MPIDIDTALKDAEALLARLESTKERLDEQINIIRWEIRGLRSARERYLTDDEEPAVEPGEKKWLSMPRTTAVLEMLKIIDRPASPTDVTELLHEVGRDDQVNPVGAALAYLHQQKKVKSLGRGQWVPVEWEETPQEIPPPWAESENGGDEDSAEPEDVS